MNFPPGISWPSNVYLVLSTFCFLSPSSHQPLNHSAAFLQNLPKLAASCRLVVVQCFPHSSSSSCRAWKSSLLPDFLGVCADIGALDRVRRILGVLKGLEGEVGSGEGRANPPVVLPEQLTQKQWNCVGCWLCASLSALMQKWKSQYRGQGDKCRVPTAVPMAKQVVLGRLFDPSETQFSLQPLSVSSV